MRAHSTVKLRGRIYADLLLCATFILAPPCLLQAESVLHGPPYAAFWTQPAHLAAGDAVFRVEFEITAGIDGRDPAIRPERLFLSHPYPNPFNAGVTFELALGPGDWSVTIYDLLGRRVQSWSGRLALPGRLRLAWEPAAAATAGAGSGLYLARAQSGAVVETRKIIYLK